MPLLSTSQDRPFGDSMSKFYLTDAGKLSSPFRVWITNKWYDHREEVAIWGGEIYGSPEEYFRKHKWFLKTVFQKEKRHAQ